MTFSPTTRTSRRLLSAGLPLFAASLVVAGCSSSGSSGNAASGGASRSSSQVAAGGSSSTSGVKISAGHLTDNAGRSVYLWAADTGGTSTCTGACRKVWPAVPASGTPTATRGAKSADLTTIKRSDGGTQLAYAGHPLYYFAEDTAAGDAKGEGSDSFGAKWWELDSSGHAITTASSSSSSGGGGGYGY